MKTVHWLGLVAHTQYLGGSGRRTTSRMGPARLHKIPGHPVLRRQTEKKILHLQIALTVPGVLYLFVMTGKLAHSPTFSVSFPLPNAYKTAKT